MLVSFVLVAGGDGSRGGVAVWPDRCFGDQPPQGRGQHARGHARGAYLILVLDPSLCMQEATQEVRKRCVFDPRVSESCYLRVVHVARAYFVLS